MPDKEERLFREHERFLKSHGGTFFNCGWSTGESFIHSKTTVGRLYSEVVRGRVHHWWTPGGECGFSRTIKSPMQARRGKRGAKR